MAWIDYKMDNDMVPQSWILHCLKMYKIPDVAIKFIEKTMETKRVELSAGGKSLAEVNSQRGIFQRDTLSPLLFVIAMISVNHILKKYTTGYKLSKSREKINHIMYTGDIKLPNQEIIRTPGEKETHLGILEVDTIKQVAKKEKN